MNSAATRLRESLNRLFPEQFELDIGEDGFVLLTVISDRFLGQNRTERFKQIEPLLTVEGLKPGIIELYTIKEARDDNIAIQKPPIQLAPSSWEDAIAMLSCGKTLPANKREHPIKRVVFYSYKGGVGRTTALIQTAFQLVRNGKRVALVDMDVEAPGLQALLRPTDTPLDTGLIDYLWERQVCFFDIDQRPSIHLSENQQGRRTGIVYSINDAHSRRDLFIVPAGSIGQRYIQRLSALTTAQLFSSTEDPWYKFEQELWKEFQPDIMLIDSRTGLNEWGGLSLLRLADEAYIVMYPSEQNAEGICFVRKLLKELGGIRPKIILSPVPEGIIGKSLQRFLYQKVTQTNS